MAGNTTRVLASDLDALSSVPEDELRLRHRRLPGLSVRDPGQALPRQARLQPQRPQQGQPALPAARLADAGAALELELARRRQPPQQHDRPQLRELELRDPREHQVGRRRVELDPELEHGQQPDRRLHQERREPPAERISCSRWWTSARRLERLHDVRLRALHAREPAPVPHVPGAGQLHLEPLEAHVHVRRHRRALPLRQRVLPGLAERLRLQLARRLLHRRQRLPGEPEPHDLARARSRSSRCAGTTSPEQTEPLQPLDVWYGGALRARTSGRPATT